jgi:hypothetical protein
MTGQRSKIRLLLLMVIPITLILGVGCGEEPGADELLTVVEIMAEGGQVQGTGGGDSLITQVSVTFRDWFNGAVVVEARSSSSLTIADLAPLLAGEAEDHAAAWERVMAASTSAGLSARAVVGYRGLIREPVLELPIAFPGGDSVMGNFLVAYLAEVEEVERRGAPDSLVITPFGREAGILNDVVPVVIGVGQ